MVYDVLKFIDRIPNDYNFLRLFLSTHFDSVAVCYKMTSRDLRRYVFHHVNFDEFESLIVPDDFCMDCDVEIDCEADIGCVTCACDNNPLAYRCLRSGEVDVKLRCLVLCDLLLREVFGDNV